jgi:hypothetical protein
MAVIEAYVDDPNVKFMLTERDPEKWVAPFNNTAGTLMKRPIASRWSSFGSSMAH